MKTCRLNIASCIICPRNLKLGKCSPVNAPASHRERILEELNIQEKVLNHVYDYSEHILQVILYYTMGIISVVLYKVMSTSDGLYIVRGFSS